MNAPVSPVTAVPSHRAATSQPRARHARVAEVDWLRTLIVLAIIPYHAIILFSSASATVLTNTFHNAQLPIIFGALEAWGIPLIFLLAGASSKFALDARSPAVYLKERFLRLLVPVALVMLVFAPLRAYYLLLSNPELASISPRPIAHPEQLSNIFTFFQVYLTTLFTTSYPIVVRNTLAHLWFVPRLLAAAVIFLPLFLYLRERWPRWMARLAPSRVAVAALLLVAGFVPAALVAVLQPGWLHRLTAEISLYEDWTTFSLQLVMFLFGYLIYASASLRAAIRDLAYVMLALAGVCWSVVIGVRLLGHTPPNTFSLANVLFALLQVFAVWLLTLAVVGLAMRYLTKSPPWLRYLSSAAFPVYILHLPLLTIVAYYLQALPVPWYVLLVLITVVTLALSFALYEYVVRRVPGIRLLFGLASPRSEPQRR
ncbi:MAG: acyltransferase family protein [Nitrososphaerota archaeon]